MVAGAGFGGSVVCLAPDNLVQDIRAAVAAEYPARSGMSCVCVCLYTTHTHCTHAYTHTLSLYAHLPLYIYAEDYSGRSGGVHATLGVYMSLRGCLGNMPRLMYADVWTYAQEACKQQSTSAAPAAARESSIRKYTQKRIAFQKSDACADIIR